jgi:hypothetical protein
MTPAAFGVKAHENTTLFRKLMKEKDRRIVEN